MPRQLSLTDIPDRLSEAEFWDLFGRVEHEQLDFKRGVPDDIKDTIPAMAMTDGGLIVHGVDRDLRIVGCALSQNTLDRPGSLSTAEGAELIDEDMAVVRHLLNDLVQAGLARAEGRGPDPGTPVLPPLNSNYIAATVAKEPRG